MLMFAEFIKEQKGLSLTKIDSSSDNLVLFLDNRKEKEKKIQIKNGLQHEMTILTHQIFYR
jgi:hypothetical protein